MRVPNLVQSTALCPTILDYFQSKTPFKNSADLTSPLFLAICAVSGNFSEFEASKVGQMSQVRNICRNSRGDVVYRTSQFCIQVGQRTLGRLAVIFQECDSSASSEVERAFRLEIARQDLCAEVALYLKPEDVWEDNDIALQSPEIVIDFLAELSIPVSQRIKD